MAQRQVRSRWINGNGFTLELHIPVARYQPGSRQDEWTPMQRHQIAQAAVDSALLAIDRIEKDGLK